MALFQNDIKKLKKGAINFLYIFISPEAKGLAPVIMQRRAAQLEEIKRIYSNNADYSLNELIAIIRTGIYERYGKTPEQMLQTIYNAAAVPASAKMAGIGAETTEVLEQAAQAVQNITVDVNDNGIKKKGNFWQDAKKVIDWLIEVLQKIFGTFRDPNVYAPRSDQWKYENAPEYPKGGYEDPFKKKSSLGTWLPILLVGGVIYGMQSGKIKPLAPKRTTKKK